MLTQDWDAQAELSDQEIRDYQKHSRMQTSAGKQLQDSNRAGINAESTKNTIGLEKKRKKKKKREREREKERKRKKERKKQRKKERKKESKLRTLLQGRIDRLLH